MGVSRGVASNPAHLPDWSLVSLVSPVSLISDQTFAPLPGHLSLPENHHCNHPPLGQYVGLEFRVIHKVTVT